MEETLEKVPSVLLNVSVLIRISPYSLPLKNLFLRISATSTALEIDLPRARSLTGCLLKTIMAAIT